MTYRAPTSNLITFRKPAAVGRSDDALGIFEASHREMAHRVLHALRLIEAYVGDEQRMRAQRFLQVGSGFHDARAGQGAHVRGPP
ncbi:hypothetical protein [Microvirga solisilvae]|uniref:hypothetical protein n=1 Tax=Microvirga solisilvae TaxID=2919498 RepID=UPI001FB02480|nr:hypothetical protein [Microvirga solisilvae]